MRDFVIGVGVLGFVLALLVGVLVWTESCGRTSSGHGRVPFRAERVE